ncbi:MAG TPA: hypothetical protein VLJ37_10475 [bacterium]|nr:hypothetical protein [bacterium]
MNVSVSQNILFSHVANLCGGFGVSYQAGQESGFFSSLHREGVLERDLATLDRLLRGRPVKLEDYRGVVRGLTRLRDERVADDAIQRRFEAAGHRFARCHDSAMAALEERGLTDRFVGFAIELQPLLFQQGYRPAGGPRDVAYEFRHFVEDESLIDLLDLARRYAMASGALRLEKELWEALRVAKR